MKPSKSLVENAVEVFGERDAECSEKNPCEEHGCKSCCEHDERDHGICMDCEDDANGNIYAMSKSRNE